MLFETYTTSIILSTYTLDKFKYTNIHSELSNSEYETHKEQYYWKFETSHVPKVGQE